MGGMTCCEQQQRRYPRNCMASCEQQQLQQQLQPPRHGMTTCGQQQHLQQRITLASRLLVDDDVGDAGEDTCRKCGLLMFSIQGNETCACEFDSDCTTDLGSDDSSD